LHESSKILEGLLGNYQRVRKNAFFIKIGFFHYKLRGGGFGAREFGG